MKPPAMRPRPGGGFNPGMGQFNDHMDEQAMQSAMKQKALSQMAGAQTGPNPSGGAVNPFATPGGSNMPSGSGLPPGAGLPNGMPSSDQMGMDASGQQPAGSPSVFDTVITQPVEDLAKVFLEALHLDKLLGISGNKDTPEEKAKKQAMHKRYQQLTEEQQAVARQKYQERMQQEKQREQEEEQRKQMEEQQKAASIEIPSSPQKGPAGPGGKSKKSNAIQKLQQDRKTLSSPSSAG